MSARVGAGRADVPPTTWEIPVVAACVWLLSAALLLPAGRGAAAWTFSEGWVWPRGTDALLASIGGLITGHVAAGLESAQAATVPAAWQVYAAIGVGELLLIGASIVAVRLWWNTVGPGSVRGMATRAEAEAVLGVGQLRAARVLLRPDLYRITRGNAESEPVGDDRLRRLSSRYAESGRLDQVRDGSS